MSATIPMPVKGYSEGLKYGRKTALPMSPDRRRDNERMVRESPYIAADSPTRGFWLGFVRAMRETA